MSIEEIKALRNNPNEYFKQLLLHADGNEEIAKLLRSEYYISYNKQINHNENFVNFLFEHQENSYILSYIGYIYQYGYGITKNYEKSFEYYQKAVKMNNPIATTNLGYMYQNAMYVEQDYEKALKYYLIAADMGDANAFNNLGIMYQKPMLLKQDYNKALAYYKKAKKMNILTAFYNIGSMYYYGHGVEKNYKLAKKYFKKVVELNDYYLYDLGYLYYQDGYGIKQNYQKAFECFIHSSGNKSHCFDMMTHMINNMQARYFSRYHHKLNIMIIKNKELHDIIFKYLFFKINFHRFYESNLWKLFLFIKN